MEKEFRAVQGAPLARMSQSYRLGILAILRVPSTPPTAGLARINDRVDCTITRHGNDVVARRTQRDQHQGSSDLAIIEGDVRPPDKNLVLRHRQFRAVLGKEVIGT